MYEVLWVKGNYGERQAKANAEKCAGYVEHHLNSIPRDNPNTLADNPSLVVVGSNASETSKNWGRWYSAAVSEEFGLRDAGILVGGHNGRGDWNIRRTHMPAILLEPFHVSDPTLAELARSDEGQKRLARILVESIRRFFPKGGKIAFSVGHKYKTSSPHDRGALVVGGGTEADLCEEILQKAAAMIESGVDAGDREQRVIRIVKDGRTVQELPVDEDAIVAWSSKRDTLVIEGPTL